MKHLLDCRQSVKGGSKPYEWASPSQMMEETRVSIPIVSARHEYARPRHWRPRVIQGQLVGVMIAAIVAAACSPAVSPAPASGGPSDAPPTTSAPVAPSSAAPQANAETLSVGIYQEFTSFFPWGAGSGGDVLVENLHWDKLAAWDSKNEPQYRLAESIAPNADATEWTVKLRQGVTWSDGAPFSSEDVLYTWKLNANPNASFNASLWDGVVGVTAWRDAGDFSADIAGITAPDAQTVVFKLTTPSAAFLATLLNDYNFILPAHTLGTDIFKLSQKDILEDPFWQKPTVGIGPYIWANTVTGQYFEFDANPNYWSGPPPFAKIIAKPLTDFAVTATQLSSGELDFGQVTLGDLSGLEAAGLTVGTKADTGPVEFQFNHASSVLRDKRVRQAMMYACDRRGFVASFLQGKGEATDTFFAPSWVPKDGIKEYPYDPAMAKSLLDAAAADGKFDYDQTLQFLQWNVEARDRQTFAEDCQSKLTAIGVKTELIPGLDVFVARSAAGDWDMRISGGAAIYDPNEVSQYYSCAAIGGTVEKNGYKSGGTNASNYCNPAFDDLMSKASAISDQSQRAALYKQAQDILLEDAVSVPAYKNASAFAWNPKLSPILHEPYSWSLTVPQWSIAP